MKKILILLAVLLTTGWVASTADAAIIVGRISHVEGNIYRYMDADDSLVKTHLHSPVGIEDVLTVGDRSRAEITFPNNVQVRLDGKAEIEILGLEEEDSIFYLHAGLARFYNQNSASALAVETPEGTARVKPNSAVDITAAGNSVVVSAVYGEATFQSFENGVEKVDAISGSTSLEFSAASIVAGVGPVDRQWDVWCAGREKAGAKNRLVRSKHLPETMQEYAYTLEPYGSWRRIYYRGYYYWAWRPKYVSAGWAPYSTGYWYDWQDEPVWIDQNPWGWATHHHGHWIHLHGAWMWTPYVHVSHVPGVTVIGLNITFGRKYRPHWHPGRVRWIRHSSHIGWLPLAPWETYYGYRSWGPRSVVVHNGVSLSININLARHRYVEHAVVIPKRHFHKRGGRVTINNYNTVKIKNINKTVIVNNYTPVAAAEDRRSRKHATRVARHGGSKTGTVLQVQRKTAKRESVKREKLRYRPDSVNQAQKKGPEERHTVRGRKPGAGENAGAKEYRGERAGKGKRQKKVVRSRQTTGVRKNESREKTIEKRSTAARNKAQRGADIETRNKKRNSLSRQDVASASERGRKNNTAAGRISAEERKTIRKQAHIEKRQDQQNVDRSRETGKKISGRHAENEKRKDFTGKRKNRELQQYGGRQNISREQRGERKRKGRDFASTSINNRRAR